MLKQSHLTDAAQLCAAFLFILNAFESPPLLAAEEEIKPDSLRRIAWSAAPDYIQKQIKYLVMNCTTGSVTPDRAGIYEYYSPQFPDKRNYVIDYLAWMKEPPSEMCSGPRPCEKDSCLLFAYTQIGKNDWKQSIRISIQNIEPTQTQSEDTIVPLIDVTQDGRGCRLANGGTNRCKTRFTWYGGTFRYFGFGKEEKAVPFTVNPKDGGLVAPPDMPKEESDEKKNNYKHDTQDIDETE